MSFTIRAATLAAAALIAAPALAATWDMPTPYGDGIFHTKNVRQFAEDVSEATGGELELTIHSAGSLFPHPEIKGAIRSMQVPIGEFFLSRLSNEDAAYGLDSQPFLATSYEEAQALWDAQKPVITNDEVSDVSALNGLRFRAYNAQLEAFAQAAGAQPVQVEAPDIPQAFSTGQVEAMITSPSTGVNSKAWDFLSHYTPINAWVPKNLVVVNQRAFDRLPEDQQQALLDASTAAEERGREMSIAEADEMTQALADNGITVYEPSEELVSGLQEIGTTMLDDMKGSASEETKAILDDFQN